MGFRVKHLKGAIAAFVLSGVFAIAEALPSLAGGFTQPKNFNFTSLSYSNFDTDTFHKQEIQFYLGPGSTVRPYTREVCSKHIEATNLLI